MLPSATTTGGAGRGRSYCGMATVTFVVSTKNSTDPKCTICPGVRKNLVTRLPFTNVPFVELQSRNNTLPPPNTNSQWCAEIVGCSI